jgi:hypothetical protein
MKALKLILLAVVCCAAMATAEDKKTEMQGMPEMGPPKEMAAMAGLVGTWTMEMKMKMAPSDTAWATTTGTAMWKSELGGSTMRMDLKSSMMGMPFEGVAYWTYDRETKMWQNVWIDNMGANMMMATGNADKDGKIVMTGETMMMGQKFMVRQTTTMVSETKHDWTYEMSNDGGKTWWTSMTATYTKK